MINRLYFWYKDNLGEPLNELHKRGVYIGPWLHNHKELFTFKIQKLWYFKYKG